MLWKQGVRFKVINISYQISNGFAVSKLYKA